MLTIEVITSINNIHSRHSWLHTQQMNTNSQINGKYSESDVQNTQLHIKILYFAVNDLMLDASIDVYCSSLKLRIVFN